MSRPSFELADIIKKFATQFFLQYKPNAHQQKILNTLSVCRTSALGGHKEKCSCCHKTLVSYNSCRNRHCPKCQSSKQAFWVEDLLATTLAVKHYHVVFTIPHVLNKVCIQNSEWFYARLFANVWETLRQLGYSRFGVECGAICVLHTWGQNLSLHPHIHCIVPAIGETLAGNTKYIGHNGKYLFPVKQLSLVFRAKMMGSIQMQLKKQGLLPSFDTLLSEAWQKPWVVFCEPSMAKADHVVKYLGQYTHRVAITNQRILNITGQSVTFLHKDYGDGALQKPVTMPGVEFLRRFCMHILPHRFVKIRRYGIYSSRARVLKQAQNPKMKVKTTLLETIPERIKRLTGFDVLRCPFCKKGIMQVVEIVPKIRSPTSFYSRIANCKTL